MTEAEKKPLPEGIAYVDDLIAKHYANLPKGAHVPTGLKGEKFVNDVLVDVAEGCVDTHDIDRYRWLAADKENMDWMNKVSSPEFMDMDDYDFSEAVGRAQSAKAEDIISSFAYIDFVAIVCLNWIKDRGIVAIDEGGFERKVCDAAIDLGVDRVEDLTRYAAELLGRLPGQKPLRFTTLTKEQVEALPAGALLASSPKEVPRVPAGWIVVQEEIDRLFEQGLPSDAKRIDVDDEKARIHEAMSDAAEFSVYTQEDELARWLGESTEHVEYLKFSIEEEAEVNSGPFAKEVDPWTIVGRAQKLYVGDRLDNSIEYVSAYIALSKLKGDGIVAIAPETLDYLNVFAKALNADHTVWKARDCADEAVREASADLGGKASSMTAAQLDGWRRAQAEPRIPSKAQAKRDPAEAEREARAQSAGAPTQQARGKRQER